MASLAHRKSVRTAALVEEAKTIGGKCQAGAPAASFSAKRAEASLDAVCPAEPRASEQRAACQVNEAEAQRRSTARDHSQRRG